jgi:uncharacterized protein
MKPPLLLSMTTPLGGSYEIPYHDLGPKRKAPRLALVGGIHGNELNAIFIVSRLAAHLKAIDEGKVPGQKLQERVILIPGVNVLGLHTRQRAWPFDKTDINRMFPGYALGETTQRIADAVFKTTAPAGHRIDIHASNLEFEELPQVRLYGSTEKERATARLLGLPAMVECPVNKVSTSTLLNAWKSLGGENFVVQAGCAGLLQRLVSERVIRALSHYVVRTGIVKGAPASEQDFTDVAEPHYFPLHHTVSLLSEKAGLFVGRAELGRWVAKGDLLGDIYDGFEGRVRAHVRAPIGGLLTGLRRQALLYEGDLLARIQSDKPVARGADTYLIGQGQ